MKEQDKRGMVETTGNVLSLLATRGQEALYEKNGATRLSRTGDLLITNSSLWAKLPKTYKTSLNISAPGAKATRSFWLLLTVPHGH